MTDQVLKRFTQRVRPADVEEATPPAPQQPHGKPVYQAVLLEQTNRRSPARLKVVYGNGFVSLLSYAFLTEVLCTSPQFLSLIYSHGVVTLEGRGLDALIDPLQEERIRALMCFNARHFANPEPGTTVITAIKRAKRAQINATEEEPEG